MGHLKGEIKGRFEIGGQKDSSFRKERYLHIRHGKKCKITKVLIKFLERIQNFFFNRTKEFGVIYFGESELTC